jgi:alpha-mannosidase
MKTVHLIGNAHLDPVWLWTRGEGVDPALATARPGAVAFGPRAV